ncbi:hypothetical protein [Rhizobium sp.]
MTTAADDEAPEALISNRLLFRITLAIGFLAALASALSVAGRWFGEDLVRGGNTDSRANYNVIIGQDVLTLPANVIRFEKQRKTGTAESVSIYLSWPDLEGYSRENAALFSNPQSSNGLIFAEFSQSVMSRDMSGRVEPIYSKLFAGEPVAGPAGLTIHRLSKKSGFGDEKLLTGKLPDGSMYAVRCLIPAANVEATSADCLRDVHVGRDLTMLYRFSSTLLPQWQEIDRAARAYAARHLAQ